MERIDKEKQRRMTSLDIHQKELLFGYSMALTSQKDSAIAKKLIAENPQASIFYETLKKALSPLDRFEVESCPDNLVENTVLRLNNTARSSKLTLSHLLEAEKKKTVTMKISIWRRVGEVVATAAVIVFVAQVVFGWLHQARQQYRQIACQQQMLRMAQGLSNYKAENEGVVPSVAGLSGQPWWKVGYQGDENVSNTRNLWLLVKKGYIGPNNFLCPGRKQSRKLRFQQLRAADFNDFPTRKHITYSFYIRSAIKQTLAGNFRIIISDSNPLFENLPDDFSGTFQLRLDDELLTLNSPNHNRKGQNILLDNGSVIFKKSRLSNISADDIFTLQNINIYKGTESPSCYTDAFLAP